jgi:hypothetical protein
MTIVDKPSLSQRPSDHGDDSSANGSFRAGVARHLTLILACGVLLAMAPLIAVSVRGSAPRHHAARAVIAPIAQASVTDLAPMLATTPDVLLTTLKEHGYEARSVDDTLDEIAARSGKLASEVLLAVMPDR